eukprot:760529-Hanusia_phi.AAC.3
MTMGEGGGGKVWGGRKGGRVWSTVPPTLCQLLPHLIFFFGIGLLSRLLFESALGLTPPLSFSNGAEQAEFRQARIPRARTTSNVLSAFPKCWFAACIEGFAGGDAARATKKTERNNIVCARL